jgi:hypothetical protein
LNSKPDSETPLQKESSKLDLNHVPRKSVEDFHQEDSNSLNSTGFQSIKPNFIRSFLDNPVIDHSLDLASVLSAVTDFKKIPQPLKQALDKYSVVLIKAAMIARYLETAVEAFKQNRVVESVGRLMGVAALPLVKLNDLTLATGLGEFIPQLDLALEGKVKQRRALNISDKPETKYENLKMWFSSLGEAYKEIFSGGLGENRKLFPAGKDEGHTLVTAGTLTFLGASLGMLLGTKSRGLANKVF